MTGSLPPLVRIEAADVTYPLREPLIVGGHRVTTRDYTLVRVTGNTGAHGHAYGITRRLAVASTIERLVGPAYLGVEAASPVEARDAAMARLGFLTSDSTVARALSLLDIALWDLAGLAVDLPVSQLLGHPTDADHRLLVVEGYLPASGETTEVRRRIQEAIAADRRAIKFSALDSPAALRTTLKRVAPEAWDGEIAIIVDLLWSLTSAAAGRAVSDALADVRIDWLEDPFPGQRLRTQEELRASLSQPVAYGDEATDPYLLDDLMSLSRIDILRLDATTLGGLTGTKAMIDRARVHGRPVSCHIYPEVHQHLAYSGTGVNFLEIFPLDGRYDAADRFRTATVTLDGSRVAKPTRAGLGLELDWGAVRRDAHSLVAVANNQV